jgi:hypothetical protein
MIWDVYGRIILKLMLEIVFGNQPVTGSCKHVNEPSGSIKDRNFLTS